MHVSEKKYGSWVQGMYKKQDLFDNTFYWTNYIDGDSRRTLFQDLLLKKKPFQISLLALTKTNPTSLCKDFALNPSTTICIFFGVIAATEGKSHEQQSS